MTTSNSLANVYRYFLDSLTDDHAASIFARNWPANTRSLAAALDRIGGPVVWQDREPSGPADDTPFVIASIDDTTRMVRFDPASAEDAEGLPLAERFAWDGSALDG